MSRFSIYPSPNRRYNMLTVPCDDALHARIVRSLAVQNEKRREIGLKPLKLTPHLRDLFRVALDSTAFQPEPLPTKPKARKIK